MTGFFPVLFSIKWKKNNLKKKIIIILKEIYKIKFLSTGF